MSASKNLGKVFMTPKGIWDKNSNYTKLDIVTNKIGKISCGYIATTDIEKNIEITDNRWLKLFELLDGDLTEEYKAVQTDVANKATDVDTNKKAVDLIYSQMQKLYDVEISTTTPTNERTGLWINPDDISGVINIPEIKDDEVSDVDTWSSKKIDKETGSLKSDISTKITKFYASSQGETHLADSDNGKIQDMMLYGKSEQKQYSGKNLVKATLESTTKNGITCTNNGDGTYTLNGTANGGDDTTVPFNVGHMIAKSGKYIVVGCPKGGSSEKYNIRIGKDNIPWGTYLSSDLGNGRLIDVTENTPITLTFMIKTGYTCNNVLFKPMIVDASLYPDTAYDDFEPYTGGIPSPNPDYPQEIKSVVNPTVKVCGKNLLNATLQTTTVNGVTCTANGDGTYTLNGTATTITTFDIAQDVSCSSFRLVGCPVGGAHDASYELQARTNNLIYGYDTGDGKNIKADENFFIRIRINTGINCNNLLFKPMIVDASLYPDATYDDFEPYHKQTVTLPYTLNAIPVSSGGNVTIDGQQYIADYVDVERGKLVRMVYVLDASANADMFRNYWEGETDGKQYLIRTDFASPPFSIEENAQTWCNKYNLLSNNFEYTRFDDCLGKKSCVYIGNPRSIQIYLSLYNQKLSTIKEQREWLKNNQTYIYVPLNTPEEADLTTEEIAAFKALATYYPITNISINSEQLDGYAVFNYPISMENGWNYVKQQIGDTREYIYDMDARAQDTDLQAAEAYVNSEYAVALTELEV